MKILITGASGFIGKNLIAELNNKKYTQILEYDRETDPSLLEEYCKDCEFVFHLAGVNRPQKDSEFIEGNVGLTVTLLETLKKWKNTCPIVITSSVQAELENPYGKSKKEMEDHLVEYHEATGANVFIFRLPNVFGKWCKPNYNSAVATFCHNIASDSAIQVNDPKVVMNLVYIDDVVNEFIYRLEQGRAKAEVFQNIPIVHTVKLGEIVDLIYSFKKSREENSVPDMSNEFIKKLYSTYLSYLPENKFSYDLKMNIDHRGSFTEFIRTPERGQISVNITVPGIAKGNHWHHTKTEKFLVVSGKGVIRFRKIDSKDIIEYFVSGDKMEVIDIPTGYTHNIENIGNTDLVTIMWANEPFDPERADTYYLEV